MFCSQCGTEVKDDAAFCKKCGSPLTGIAEASEPAVAPAPAVEATSAPAPAAETAPVTPSPKRKRTGLIAGIAIAALVVCGAVGIGLWWKADQEAKAAAAAQAEWERTHVTRVTRLEVEAPAFDDAATGIPVQVTGEDLDGNRVDEVQYLHASDRTISTLPGSYEVSFPGGYFGGNGEVVKAPGTVLVVDVPVPEKPADPKEPANSSSASSQAADDAKSGQSTSASPPSAEPSGSSPSAEPSDGSSQAAEPADGSSQAAAPADGSTQGEPADEGGIVTGETPVFTVVEPLDVTDELLKEIGDLAKADPVDNGKADQLQQAAAASHQVAVEEEQRRKEEEERRQREEAERARGLALLDGWWVTYGQSGAIHYHFHNGSFEVYDDGSASGSSARKTGSGQVISMEWIENPSFGGGAGREGPAWFYEVFSGGGGFVLYENSPDLCDCYSGYPPKGYSGSGSIGRKDPPANVLAIAE